MSFTDNLIGVLVIIFVLIAVFTFTSNRLVNEEIKEVESFQEKYLEDYYSTVMDTFLSMSPQTSIKNYNLIIGDFITRAKYISGVGQDVETLEKEMEKTLNGLIGANDYYMEIKPKFSKMRISFVIDGSYSMENERQELADRLPGLLQDLQNSMPDPNVEIDVRIYILGVDEDLCIGFDPNNCFTLAFDDLYYPNQEIIGTPHEFFGSFTTFDEWEDMGNLGPEASKEDFAGSDWMAGMIVAHKDYLATQEEPTLNILVPISDEMSSSSQANKCYGYPENGWENQVNYIVCTLCEETCPDDRQRRNLEDFKTFMRDGEARAIIIPISSFEDSYDYKKNYINGLRISDYSSQFTPCSGTEDFACKGSIICDDTAGYTCGGCRCTNCDEDATRTVGTNYKCREDAGRLMDEIAQEFDGDRINIEFLDNLAEELKNGIESAMDSLAIEVGERKEDSTRYVYERLITLPNKKTGEISLWTYNLPFDDDTTWEEPEITGPGLIIISPLNNEPYMTDSAFSLRIKTNHGASCSGTGMGLNFDFITDENGLMHTYGPIPSDGSTPAPGIYTFDYECTGVSPYYSNTDTAIHDFEIISGRCQIENGFTCDFDETCPMGFAKEYGERCCLIPCVSCQDMGGVDCSNKPIPECVNDNWIDGLEYCCDNEACGTCLSEGYEKCRNEKICVGGTQETKDYYGEDCCDGTCNTCTELGGESCTKDTGKACNSWLEFTIGCCNTGQCSTCADESLPVCNSDEKCVGTSVTWEQECCDGDCRTCTELSVNHEKCAEGLVCDGTYDGELDRCCDGGCNTCENAGGEKCNLGWACNGDWIDSELGCCDGTCVEVQVPGTTCTEYWPEAGWTASDYDGQMIYINGKNPSCSTFDVLNPDLYRYVTNARECCLGTGIQCHSRTTQSRNFAGITDTPTNDQLKKCMGRYIIYALGPTGFFAQDYYYQEGCCAGDLSGMCHGAPINTCDSNAGGAPPNPSKDGLALQCLLPGTLPKPPQYPLTWKDNEDWTKNSCYFSDVPASVSLTQLKTGQCVDYSVMSTTLLRVAGYGPDEVYTLLGPGHAFNLVKFPGETQFIIFDTTGNANVFDSGGYPYYFQTGRPPYCSYINNPSLAAKYGVTICSNDNGAQTCPKPEEVHGC